MPAKTHSFVALYSGESIATARLICASSEKSLVAWVAQCLLNCKKQEEGQDACVQAIQCGQSAALSLIVDSTEEGQEG